MAMLRRALLTLSVPVLVAATIVGGDLPEAGTAAAQAPPSRPNIVLVMTDDQEVSTLRYMGAVQAELVAKGITFTNGLVNLPLCCPSRATILRGQNANNTGIRGNTESTGGGHTPFHRSGMEVPDRRDGPAGSRLPDRLRRQVPERVPGRRPARHVRATRLGLLGRPVRRHPAELHVRAEPQRAARPGFPEGPRRAATGDRGPHLPRRRRQPALPADGVDAQPPLPLRAGGPVHGHGARPRGPPGPEDAGLQRGRHQRQAGAGRDDARERDRDGHQLPAPGRGAAVGRRHGRADRRRASPAGGSSTTPTSCTRRTTATSSASTA